MGEWFPSAPPFGGAQRTSWGCPVGTRGAIRDILTKPSEDGEEDEQISGSNMHSGLFLFWWFHLLGCSGQHGAWRAWGRASYGHHQSASLWRGASCMCLDTDVLGMCVQGVLVHLQVS